MCVFFECLLCVCSLSVCCVFVMCLMCFSYVCPNLMCSFCIRNLTTIRIHSSEILMSVSLYFERARLSIIY